MKRVKDPWRVIRQHFKKYYHDGRPWTFVESKDVFMAHNIYSVVVVTHLGKRVHRVVTFSTAGRFANVIPSPRDVYTKAIEALM